MIEKRIKTMKKIKNEKMKIKKINVENIKQEKK